MTPSAQLAATADALKALYEQHPPDNPKGFTPYNLADGAALLKPITTPIRNILPRHMHQGHRLDHAWIADRPPRIYQAEVVPVKHSLRAKHIPDNAVSEVDAQSVSTAVHLKKFMVMEEDAILESLKEQISERGHLLEHTQENFEEKLRDLILATSADTIYLHPKNLLQLNLETKAWTSYGLFRGSQYQKALVKAHPAIPEGTVLAATTVLPPYLVHVDGCPLFVNIPAPWSMGLTIDYLELDFPITNQQVLEREIITIGAPLLHLPDRFGWLQPKGH